MRLSSCTFLKIEYVIGVKQLRNLNVYKYTTKKIAANSKINIYKPSQ